MNISPLHQAAHRDHAADHRHALAGMVAFRLLPVAPLPQVDYPTISVSASLPGASPETMAATVATPLERLGAIAGVTEMTSSARRTPPASPAVRPEPTSTVPPATCRPPSTPRNLLPTGMPSNPTYRKVNPADAPIMILA
jgi:multidrug efflux pump